MRKITLFSSLVCALMFCTSAMAQGVTDLNGKGVKSIGTTPVSSLEAGKWYVMENQGNYAYDENSKLKHGNKTTLVSFAKPTSECAKALFRITSTEEAKIGETSAQKIKIQFGTGNYVQWVDYNQSIATISGGTTENTDVYAVSLSTDGFRFAKNTNTTFGSGNNLMFDRADGGPAAGTVCAWADGNSDKELSDKTKGANRLWKVYEVEVAEMVDVTIQVKNEDEDAKYTTTGLQLPKGATFTLRDYVIDNGLVIYPDIQGTITGANETFTLTYSGLLNLPCLASTYDELNTGNKWVSFFTYNGRMHVYDNRCIYKDVKKNPTIDKATFASLEDRYFWGLVCENPFTSYVKIYNKDRGGEHTLYLSDGGNDTPVLFTDKTDQVPQSWKDNKKDEWIIEKGRNEDEIQYFCIKSKYDPSQRINNNGIKGFMTTWNGGTNQDGGANIKFTPELETYTTLKERALTAPANAINSLTDEARARITEYDNTNEPPTVDGYKGVIEAINCMVNKGVVPFVDGGYYYLRNYTPEGGRTFVMDSKSGTSATTSEVTPTVANSDAMNYTNINAIWKITTDPSNPAVELGSQDIGVSKTIGRFVTHVNSGKKLDGVTKRTLSDAGETYYFVNLGAGQHFMKNKQYNGTGQQAIAKPLRSYDSGGLGTNAEEGQEHKKNSRYTWYGIPVNSIDITITEAGYATIYLPFGVTLPEDNSLTAYAVTAAADGVATLTEVKNIPANEGVILKGTAGKKYTLTINDNVSWEGITNLLEGSRMATNVTEDAYVLAKPANKEVGLYRAEMNQESGAAWRNNDNKAYLPADVVTTGDARFLSFNFDTVTGLDVINGTESTSAEASAVYDLSGRRVRTAQKGLYIMNGKKVIK